MFLVDEPNGIATMDEDRNCSLSCAIEVCDISSDVTQEFLSNFFYNRKRSGGDMIEELLYDTEEHRAVITFRTPEGKF